jgi:RimJ/RimL family protein N-acetyltransferase
MPPHAFTIPRLPTNRLLLREHRASDFDAYAKHVTDPLASVHLTPMPDRRTAWRAFSSGAGAWALAGGGWWTLELRETGEPVGFVGAFFRETVLERFPLGGADPEADVELGWSVLREHWHRGYAREAAHEALRWAFSAFAVQRAIAYIDPRNEASLGVARAIGMHDDGEADFYGEPTRRFAVARSARAQGDV